MYHPKQKIFVLLKRMLFMITPGPKLYSRARRIYSHKGCRDQRSEIYRFNQNKTKQNKTKKARRDLGWGGRITKKEFSALPCPDPPKL